MRAATTAAALFLGFDEGISPSRPAGPGDEPGEEGPLALDDRVVRGCGHRSEQVGLVVAVVVGLTTRRRSARSDLVQAGPQSTLLGPDLRSGGHDPPTGVSPLLGHR
jgi:hypothetical protein